MKGKLSEERRQHILQDYSRGFVAFCGLEPVRLEPGFLEARVLIREEHRQQDGFIHAGLMATLADHTAGYASYTMIPETHRILTVEFKMNFLRPAFGQELICRAKVIKPGRRILICESEVYDQRPEGEAMVVKNLTTMASVPESELKKNV